MASIDPLGSGISPLGPLGPADAAGIQQSDLPSAAPASGEGFGSMLEGLISAVDAKQAESEAISNQVMLGASGQLHQSVIAMEEATTALSLMVQVRNNLVSSYQELMRMQV